MTTPREQARIDGAKRYAGTCLHGHTVGFYTSTGACCECQKLATKKCDAEHKEDRAAMRRKWRANNKESVSAAMRRARAKRKDKEAAENAAYRAKHKDRLNARARAYQKANLDIFRALNSKRRARKAGGGGSHTPAQVSDLMRSQQGMCIYCRVDIRGLFHRDHIRAVVDGGTDDIQNIQLLCPPCNLSKHAKDPIEFAQQRGFLL